MDDNERIKQDANLIGPGSVAQGQYAKSVGKNGVLIEGGMRGDFYQIIFENAKKNRLPFPEALAQYLDYIITTYQNLQLRGIPIGNKPPLVPLEKVYISLKISESEDVINRDIDSLSLASAMQRYRHLVIVGEPGCGKTTLISYLGLTFARALAGDKDLVKDRLNLDDVSDYLPVILPLRYIGEYVLERKTSVRGTKLLLDYVREYYQAQNISLPEEFFDLYLDNKDNNKNIILLLDGIDEVVDSVRGRTTELIDNFAAQYNSKCRFIVTGRKAAYKDSCRLGGNFEVTEVRNFTPQEVRQFVKDWTRITETTLAGNDMPETLNRASDQAENLIHEIESNLHVFDLVANPLLLTVVCMVYRHHLKWRGVAKLPERRYDLYAQAVEILLAHWDGAKGIDALSATEKYELDVDDHRNLLENVAFWMHERNKREIEMEDLNKVLLPMLENVTKDHSAAPKLLKSFIAQINTRSGLLVERSMGIYGFAHLTFQEYLAARALAKRVDAVEFTLKHLQEDWWREVILLEAGYLSTLGKHSVSDLLRAIKGAKSNKEDDSAHNLLLAAEYLVSIGNQGVEGNLLGEIQAELQKQSAAPIQRGSKQSVMVKINANNALAKINSGLISTRIWKFPYGEPEWITVPSGEAWIGSEDYKDEDGKDGNKIQNPDTEKPLHKIYLREYKISLTPITNAQYAFYIKDAGVKAPSHWRGTEIPIGLERHPVVNITWFEANAYCQWLSEKINKVVTMPSEVEWEKAARGETSVCIPNNKLEYPWGKWEQWRCNSAELWEEEPATTMVDQFINGASTYNLLDLSGNIWEWTRSVYKDYPYNPADGREDPQSSDPRVRRGGCFRSSADSVRHAYRGWYVMDSSSDDLGFRVAIISTQKTGDTS